MKAKFTFFLLISTFLTSFVQGQVCSIYTFADDQPSTLLYQGENGKAYLDSLNQIGFYALKIKNKKEEPCEIYIQKGKQYKKIYLQSNQTSLLNKAEYDQAKNQFYTHNLEQFVQHIKDSLNQTGQVFDKIELQPKGFLDGYAIVALDIEATEKRTIDDIKYVGYTKAPQFVKKNLLKKPLIYNEENIQLIQKQMSEYTFFTTTASPKVSFTKDSTTLYMYLKKNRLSSFSGILGFETDEANKLQLQGDVKLQLMNAFHRFEKIGINWKSGLHSSQYLNVATFIPYIFNSPLAFDTKLDLTKQDSTFFKLSWQNSLLYELGPNHYLGASYSMASSNYIDDNTKDFNKNGFGINYQYTDAHSLVLQENKTRIQLNSTLWKRKTKNEQNNSENQTEVIYLVERQQQLYKNHYFNGRISGGNLIQEGEILINDLYQLGGYNSLRGFNQNAIVSPAFNILSLAYRYIPNDKIFFEAFGDLGWVRDKTGQSTNQLTGYGIGMQFGTKFGWFEIDYAIGNNKGNSFNLTEGKIHIGIKNFF